MVPGSRGQATNDRFQVQPPRTAPPLNLVSMRKETEERKSGLKSKMKLKQAVIMPKPMIYSKNSQVAANATRIAKKVKK